MTFAVHCAPWVSVCTPGCTAAVAAGAQAGELRAGASPATPENTTSSTPRRAAKGRTRGVRIATTYPHRTVGKAAPEPLLTGLSGDVQQDPGGAHRDHERRPTGRDERQRDARHRADTDHG